MKMKVSRNKIVLLTLWMGGIPFAIRAQTTDTQVAEKALQESKEITWEANKDLEKDQFVSAEGKYRKAISKSRENAVAPYNLGNALYENESYSEAFGSFKQAGETATDKAAKHQAYHNMGNVFMKNKEYEKAVDAYKESLRNDPTDEETRYNLALAKEMLKKQQNEQKNNDDKDKKDQKDQKEQNKDQNKDKDDQNKQQQNQDQKKDQGDQGDKGDQGNQGDQQKEENKKGDGQEKQEKQKQPQPGDQKDQQQAPRPNQLSPQQIQNLLEAMQNEERKVQEKLDAQKVKGVPVKNKKDW